jgi:putative phosphoesterase
MRIAVLADTHDRLPEHILEAIGGADEIWHLGDVTTAAIIERLQGRGRPLRVVRGNCDEDRGWPYALDFEIAGRRIRLIHVPPPGPLAEIDLLLHGHTHVPRNEVVGATRFLNPGCITRPNRGAPASYAWLELNPNQPPGWSIVRV